MGHQSKKTTNGKKLSLSKETLRQLGDIDLVEVAGGTKTNRCPGTLGGPTANCTNPC
jgi:hypothetical protein